MADISETNGVSMNDGNTQEDSGFCVSLTLIQKVIAEFVGTYFLVFGGCAAVVVNLDTNNAVTLPGISLTFGLILMVMIYAVGHISGGHFNPAVTIAFAICKKFPWKHVPGYVLSQVLGSIFASGSLRLIFKGKQDHFAGTLPTGSDVQALALEFVITFYLMFVIYAVSIDTRANKQFAGLAVGATLSASILYTGPITGGSLNPARSLGPAIVSNHYTSLWIYIIGPTAGAVTGAWVCNILRPTTNNSFRDITKNFVCPRRG